MSSESQAAPSSKWMFWVGWVLGVLPAPLLLMSAYAKLAKSQQVVEGMQQMGWPLTVSVPLGIVELTCLVLYLIPQTAVLGAILMTGYLGGAVATHLRIEDYPHFIIPAVLGAVFWLGLFLRDERIRQLIPIRTLPR